MTRQDQALIAIGLAAAAAALLFATGSMPLPRHLAQAPDGAVQGVGWDPAYPEGHEHLCHPFEMDACLTGGHPLFRRHQPGAARSALIEHGWSWIADPPSEEVL